MSRRGKGFLLGVALLSAGVLVSAEEAADPRPECQQAEEWARTHMQQLPSTLDSLLQFSPDYRARIFAALPAAKKAEIWQTHLQDAAARPLSPAQRALVNEAIALVTPDLYDSGRTFPEAWRNRVREEFSRNEAIDIFESLGPGPDGR